MPWAHCQLRLQTHSGWLGLASCALCLWYMCMPVGLPCASLPSALPTSTVAAARLTDHRHSLCHCHLEPTSPSHGPWSGASNLIDGRGSRVGIRLSGSYASRARSMYLSRL